MVEALRAIHAPIHKPTFCSVTGRGIVSHSDGAWEQDSGRVFFYLTPMDEQVSATRKFVSHYLSHLLSLIPMGE